MLQALSVITPRFILLVCAGSAAGLFVGALPGISVTMATALLVSITYTWPVNDAMALIMGVYVVGVFSGAVSAILIGIPGAPSSIATTLDGFPMAQRGEAYKALWAATVFSFVGSLIGLAALWALAGPVSRIALQFAPMDFFLLALLGLMTVGSLSGGSMVRGLVSAAIGVALGLVGADPIMGTGRFTFGSMHLYAGIPTVPALIGLFGFSEILEQVLTRNFAPVAGSMRRTKIPRGLLTRHLPLALRSSLIGTLIGALPGAGGPLAALLAYSSARRTVKNPQVPFGEGAVEGVVASESANNAVVGGALIPLLTLAVPGDAVTAILLSIFTVHGLRPGPMMIAENPAMFYTIVLGGLLATVAMLGLGLFAAPRLARVITVPKSRLMPVVAVLCVIGAYASGARMSDVIIMLAMGALALLLRRNGFPIAPVVLGLVLGGMMDANFRRAVSQAGSADHLLIGLFGRPVTIVLALAVLMAVIGSVPAVRRARTRLWQRVRGQEAG